MRAGGCTVQQALTPEAASTIKQAVSLARRRGHAQVTPLHVANTMLSSSTGLLRAACLQSHSHPLQCKALELCFNVALNRLPASTSSGPMLGPHQTHHHHPPSLSNALVAAFKRAQAHQRRGSIESQQQPLLAVKIEIEQLIISILDDPSVSRVMREAGFSSTHVKSNVEQAVSLQICTPTPSSTANPSKPKEGNNTSLLLTPPQTNKTCRPLDYQVRSEDVASVVECLIHRRKRSIVVVGECLATTEGVVKGVMDQVDKGEVPEVLREVQFINLPLFSFGRLSKEEVEQKIGELRCLVKSCCGGRSGAVLYLGDLKWATDEFRASSGEKGSYYCPVEHAIMEVGRLICGAIGEEGSSGNIWLMGISTYQTYTRCRVGNPSLETVWGLHPLTIPSGNLGLSLNYDSDLQSQLRNKRSGDASCWSLFRDGLENQLNCCADCSVKFEIEVRGLSNSSSRRDHGPISSSLPSWLQQYKEENKRATAINDQDHVQVRDLCRKWNSICHSSSHKQHNLSEKTLNLSSVTPPPSISSYDRHYSNLHQTHLAWPVPVNVKHPWKEQRFWISGSLDEGVVRNPRDYGHTSPLHTHPNPSPISSSSSDTMETEYRQRFKELNAENLKTLCHALEKKVFWQQEIIPEIASTILQCRSGMIRRRDKSSSARTKADTWLLFLGGDVEGKEKIARELASLVFGSLTSFTKIGSSSFSSARSESTDDSRSKRSRSEASHSYLERFAEAIRSNPHSVIFMEDIDQVDYHSQMGIKRTIERGRISGSGDEEVCLGDAIIILSCESFESRSRASSPPSKQKLDNEEEYGVDSEKETLSCFSLDLNLSVGDAVMDDQSFDDVGLVELVDRRFFFKLQQDL